MMRVHSLQLLAFVATAALAQERLPRPTLAKPGSTAAADAVDNYIRLEMARQQIPGLSLAVVKDGRIAKSAAYGLASVELNVPATKHTEFAIASMTKSVTASAVMLLVQDGKLRLDDPVSKYIDSIPDSWRSITIEHLLTHTSGIKDHYGDFPAFSRVKLDRRLEYSDAEYLKAHFQEPLNFMPGEYGAYSGSNFALLGLIITKVTGKPYERFFEERIFAPLGMMDTHLLGGRDIIPNRASGYALRNKAVITPQYTGVSFMEKADVSVVTTAADLAKWIIALTDGHLWTKQSVGRMWSPATLNDGREAAGGAGSAYGAGWIIGRDNGFPMIGHGGTFNIGFTSAMAIFPDQRLAIIVLDNDWDADPSRIAHGIAGFFDPALRAPHLRSADSTPHTDLISAVQKLVPALFGVRTDIDSLTTAGFARFLSAIPPVPGPPPSAPPPPQPSFIALDEISPRHLVRYGSPVARMAHLKIVDNGDEHFLTVYLTANGKIADISGY
jgi:CubicO group peptidase (beta-lactamase class C family)